MCSREEIATVKTVLSPPEEKIIKAHLLDIKDGGDGAGPELILRAVDGSGTIFRRPIEPGKLTRKHCARANS